MKISACASAILLFLCWETVRITAKIQLVKNGYENVIVAIGASVREDSNIIPRIKALFTSGSRYLYRATRYRAYFRNVTIIVPSSWSSEPDVYEIASNDETCDNAALRVDTPNPAFDDKPYTQSYSSKCGDQQMYIHLTPYFVTNETFASQTYGPPGKVLVHEWAHFRWGVFDEYPHSGDRHFYLHDSDQDLPVMCSSSLKGKWRNNVSNKTCGYDQTFRLEENCRWVPKPVQKLTTASYMYNQALNNIEDFCDEKGTFVDGKSIEHNKKAPSRQNSMCKGKSVWEVMRSTNDFKEDKNAKNNESLNTTPSFKLIQPRKTPKVVLLFDVSGSMSGDPIKMMSQAATNFINQLIKNGTYLGIVSFNKTAHTLLNMTMIKANDRTFATGRIPTTASGATGIGTGMQHAMNVLNRTLAGEKDWPARGAHVILLTDGEHNSGEPPLSKINSSKELGITFHTIGYSRNSDPDLEEIAERTGGKYVFSTINVANKSHVLFKAFSGIAESMYGGCSENVGSLPVTVKSSVDVVIGNDTLQGNFAIDNTTGKDTTITFNYMYMYMYMSQQPCLVEIRLQKPDGSIIDKNDTANYQANNESQIIQIDIPGIALAGEWNYTISCPCNTSVLVNVLSKPIGDKEAIRVQTWSRDMDSPLESGPGAKKSIYAKVSQGYTPVSGLKVTGVIEGSTKEGFKTIYVDLQDNGIATDLLANDGIYSAKFGRFVVNDEGRYSVTIQVDNPDNTAKIAKYSYIMVSGAASIGTEPVKPIATYQAVGPIQRVSAAGELRVERPDYATPVDVIPPPRIRDLQLVRLDIEEAKVTLKWTAVGDDVSHSSNTKYDLRLGTFEEVSERFENSSQIHLPVTPRKAGEGEEQEIDMTDYNKTATYFLAIRAIDEAGNKGDPSNIISLSMTLPTRFSNGDPIVTKLPRLPRLVTPPLQMMIILACVGAGAVILMSVNVGVVYYYRKRRNLKTTPAGMAGEQRDVIDAEKGGSASNYPQADQKGQEAPIYHAGQEGIAPRPSAYDNMGFGKVANLVQQFEVL